MTTLSARVRRIGVSPTLRISALAKSMRAEGIDVIDLSIGEPDFASPTVAKAGAIRAIETDFTHYTPAAGTPSLRAAIASWLERHFGVAYEPTSVIVSNGAKQAIANAMLALLDPGDEVVIPAPWWVSYPELASLADGVPVFVETREEEGFRMSPAALRAALTPRTKLLVLNNPSNPTGTAYGREELAALVDAALEHERLWIVSDEIYAQLTYDDFAFTSVAALGEEAKRRSILVSGASKSFAMTGWRIGFAAGPREIVAAMAKLQGHITSNASSISQAAAEAAFAADPDEVGAMRDAFADRREEVLRRIAAWPRVTCHRPEGAFYVFPNVSAWFDATWNGTPIGGSERLAEYILETARVAVIPGSAFGAEGFLRLSYAASMEQLVKGLDRVRAALASLGASGSAGTAG